MMRKSLSVLFASAVSVLLLACLLAAPAAAGPVRHPNLLYTSQELAALKQKIETQPWAKALWEREISRPSAVVQAFRYALYGDAAAGQSVKQGLFSSITYWERQGAVPNLDWTDALGYDLTYDLYSAEERVQVEAALLQAAGAMKREGEVGYSTPNLNYIRYWKVGLIACALGNDELLDWSVNSPGGRPGYGGFKSCLDDFLFDGQWWKEANIYALCYDIHGMMLQARAMRHYNGTDLWAYQGKTGGTLKRMVDAYLKIAYPLEQTGVNGGSIRLATYGDGATREPVMVGGGGDSYIVNPPRDGKDTFDLNPFMELAYAATHDPDYAWFLSRRPARDASSGPLGAAALWYGVEALPDNPRAPRAPSSYFPDLGMAFLRSDETEQYWSGRGLACLMLGSASYGHDHRDKLHLDLYGKGRLFYSDYMTKQYEELFLNWSRHGAGHNLVLVDQQSPANDPSPTVRHEFTPEAKFYAVTARSCFEGVAETRALLLTADYLADFFHLESAEPHTYDYFLHSFGRACPSEPVAYRPSVELQPHYWWVENERSRVTDRTWSLDFVQRTAGMTPGIGWGEAWFKTQVGMRVTMTGAPGTEVYYGDGPLTNCQPYAMMDGNPEPAMPVLVARRHGKAATYCVVHAPYEMPAPGIRRVTEIARTTQAAGLRVEADTFSDRAMVAVMPEAEAAPPQRLSDGAEAFAFHGYGYLRVTGSGVVGRGGLTAFRVQAPAGAERKATLNGTPISVRRTGGFLVYGKIEPSGSAAPKAEPAAAQVNLSFFPVELRLAPGGEGKVALKIRGATPAPARGELVLAYPDSLTLTPDRISYGPLAEGEEKEFELVVAAQAEAPERLFTVRIAPDQGRGAQCSPEELPVSVGVVITEDDRLPRMGDFVIRSPRYKMRVSKTYGNSYYLLDRDGQRRHGLLYGLSFAYGFPSVRDMAVDDTASTHKYFGDILRWGLECSFFWPGKTNLSAITQWPGFRYNYRFTPEYLVFEITEASGKEYELRLGHFASPRLGDFTVQPGGNADGKGREPYQWVCVDQPPLQDRLLIMTPPQSSLRAWAYGPSLMVDFRNMRRGSRMVLGFVRPDELDDAVTRWGQEFGAPGG